MTQFSLLIVSAIAFVVTILAAVRDAGHRRYWMVCACFFFAGFTCWLAFAAIGSEVDAQGVVHEKFILVPLGWLIVVIGVIGSLIRGVFTLYRRQSHGSIEEIVEQSTDRST